MAKNKKRTKKRKNKAVEEFRLGDEFDQSFDELIAKGFIERVGTDEPDGEPKYAFTEKAQDILELRDFVKTTDAFLKEHKKIMKEVQKFIEQCRVKIEVNLPNGEKKEGSFGSGYFLDQIKKGATLEDFFIEARSFFNED